MIEYCILQTQDKKDKQFAFDQLHPVKDSSHTNLNLDKLPVICGTTPPTELLQIWTNTDMLARLLTLSAKSCLLPRRLLDLLDSSPMSKAPEHLTLALAHLCPSALPTPCRFLLDDLLTRLLPPFLSGTHAFALPILKLVWDASNDLLIRAICELCA